ncbi:MAG: hypothetical protein WC558_11785 [Patulibacter sp.]
MEVTKILVKGKNVGFLLPWFEEELREITRHPGKSGMIHVFGGEPYFLRINSDLLTVVILDFLSKSSCHITVISGGGSQGLLPSFTWGAERSANKSLRSRLEEICGEYSLTIDDTGDPAPT